MRMILEILAVVLIAVMMLGPLSMAPAYGPYVEPGTAEDFEAATTPLEEGSSNVSANDGLPSLTTPQDPAAAQEAPVRRDGATVGSQTESQTTNAPPPATP